MVTLIGAPDQAGFCLISQDRFKLAGAPDNFRSQLQNGAYSAATETDAPDSLPAIQLRMASQAGA
jgi:hypothetical protein